MAKPKQKPALYMGIDLGSTSTEAVVLDDRREIVLCKIIDTQPNHRACIDRLLSLVFADLSKIYSEPITPGDIRYCIGTGYGRENIHCASKALSEIGCHAKGARYYYPAVRTVIDIGGQDSKVISINEGGDVVDFVMNEKCAAGTGRFLEAIAEVCELSIEELGPTSLKAETETTIRSMCTVFAESEVISKLAEGASRESIIKGLHSAIAFRVLSMGKRVGITPPIAFTGGVALNSGMVRMTVDKTGLTAGDILVPPHPQLIGALGAAFFALEEEKKHLRETTPRGAVPVTSPNACSQITGELEKEIPRDIFISAPREPGKPVPVVGWTDLAVPLELLSAAGINHIRITGDMEKGSGSDRFIRTYSCAYIKNAISALFEKSEKYDFLDGLITTNGCSASERMFDVMTSQQGAYVRETGNNELFVYPMDIPRKSGEEAIDYMKANIFKLKEFLETRYGNPITVERLKETCTLYNNARRLLLEYSSLLAEKNIPNTARFIASQVETIWRHRDVTAAFITGLEQKIALLKNIKPLEKRGANILLAGSIIPDPNFYDIFDTVNCHITAHHTSSGDKFSEAMVDMEDNDIYRALARRCLYFGYTPRSMDAPSRMAKIKNLVDRFKVEGIIFNITKFCVYYTFEAVLLKEYCQQWRIPLLIIETDFTGKSTGQLKTRIEAFIETLKTQGDTV